MEYDIYIPQRGRLPLDNEQLNTLLQRKILVFKRSLFRAVVTLTEYKDAQQLFYFEFKKFNQSDNNIEEIRCCDRVIGTIYSSRTEFNHQEVLFSVFTDVFPYISEQIRDIKKRT